MSHSHITRGGVDEFASDECSDDDTLEDDFYDAQEYGNDVGVEDDLFDDSQLRNDDETV